MDNLLPHKNLSLEDIEGEIWKDIEGFEGCYQISNFGRVKSCKRYVRHPKGGELLKKERILVILNCSNKYLMIKLSKENISSQFLIHRLVALHFIDNPNKKSDVNHINSIKTDNNINNLEWTSHLENISHHRLNKICSSNYIGVSLCKKSNKWKSTIRIKNKRLHLGIYQTEEQAYQARCEYEKNNNIENKYL
jgi:hypothetical protein